MASKNLGNVLLVHRDKFYFVPADKIGQPVPLSAKQVKQFNAFIAELREREPGSFIDAAINISDPNLIQLCARN